MPKRDILLYNSASRGFTTNLGSDTVRIQGSSDELLSIQNSGGTEQLKVGTSKTSLTFNSPLTASGHFSGSSVSSASFGRVVAATFHGDGSEMTDTPISSGTVSSSAQFASEISGAFDSGFEFVGTISGSSTTTGSFANLNAADGFSLGMDISGVTNRIASGVVSGAAQIATEISGAFQGGFDFTGGISGSRTSTGSFSLVHTDAIRQGDGRFLTNISYTPSTFSSSAQIASEISGAFTEGFQFEGTLGGVTPEITTTKSFKLDQSDDWLQMTNAAPLEAYDGDPAGHDRYILSLWFKVNTAPTAYSDYIFSTGAGSWTWGGQYLFMGYNGDHSVRFTMQIPVADPSFTQAGAGGSYNTMVYSAFTLGTAEVGKWHNVIISYDRHLAPAGTGKSAGDPGITVSSGSANVIFDGETIAVRPAASGSLIAGYATSATLGAYYGHGSRTTYNTDITVGDFTLWKHSFPSASNDTGIASGSIISALFNRGIIPDYTANYSTDYPSVLRDNIAFAYNFESSSYNSEVFTFYDRTGQTTWPLVSAGTPETALVSSSADTPRTAVGQFFDNSGSFGNLIATTYNDHSSGTDISEVTNIIPASTVSSSAQIAADISGSFTSGFEYGGNIAGTSGYSAGGTWSVGGNLNTARTFLAGTGTKAAALAVGGVNCNHTEEYNGTSFSEVNNLNGARGMLVGTGTTEASVFYGGGPSKTAATEEWNGTNWSEVNDLIKARFSHAKLGTTSEAALAVGGNTTEGGNEDTDVEDWNGTNWSAGTAILANAGYGSSFGGYDSGIVTTYTEYYCWNGTNWSDEGGLITANRYYDVGAGSSNDGWIAGGTAGGLGGINNNVEYYNGTSWSTGTNMITSRQKAGSADSLNTGAPSAMVFGGDNPSALNSAEEFTAGSQLVSASFGHIIVDDLTAGSITNLCEIANVIPSVMISSSAQIASDISGSFTSGFGYAGTISGSATSTGSFSLLNVSEDYNIGDVSEVTNAIAALTTGTVSSSAQLATDISGSFIKGFEFSGTISGSSTSKLDVSRLDFTSLSVSDFANSELTGIIPTGTLTNGSATSIASQISGAFDSGFEFTGAISGSSTASGSFNIVCANQFPTVDLTGMTGLDQSGHLSSSAQLATDISGSFTSGFEASEPITISGSSTSTGSFAILGVSRFSAKQGCAIANTQYVVSDVSGVTNFKPPGLVSGSAQLGISGSFQKGYIPEAGLISGSSTSTGSFNYFHGQELHTSDIENKGMTVIPVEEYGKVYSTQNWDATGSLSPSGSDGYGDTGLGTFSQYDNDYGVAGQLFVTNDGLLNITYETGSTVAVPPVWTEGPDTVSNRSDHASVFGTQNATLIAGGRNPADTSFTEDFNGISWTELNDLTVSAHRGAGAGTTNAGIQFGGATSPKAKTEIWNGVTWHSAQNLGTGRATLAGAGTQNSALAMSGYTPGLVTNTELFNGISWSELNDNITGRRLVGGDGTSEAAFIAAGGTPAKVACTEEWNGSVWSAGGALGAARYGQGSWGSVNAAVQAGGGGVSNLTEEYNGTSWSETTNTISAIIENNAAGDAGLGMTIRNQTVVEMWTGGFIPSSSFGDPNNYLKTCKIKPNLISHYSGSSQEDN